MIVMDTFGAQLTISLRKLQRLQQNVNLFVVFLLAFNVVCVVVYPTNAFTHKTDSVFTIITTKKFQAAFNSCAQVNLKGS